MKTYQFPVGRMLRSFVLYTAVILLTGLNLKAADDPIVGRWPNGICNSVDVSGQTVFMANGSSVQIYSISVITSPVKLGEVLFPGVVKKIKYFSNHLYVVTTIGFYIVDLNSGANLQIVYKEEPFQGALSLTLENGKAFVAYASRIKIYDITDPANPAVLGTYDVTDMNELAVTDTLLCYVYSGNMEILNISEPDSIKLINTVDTLDYVYAVALNYPYAYLADKGGIRVLDISDPAHPVQSDLLTLDNQYARGVYYDFATSRLFCTDYSSTYLYDASAGDHPVFISKYSTGSSKDVTYLNNYAFISSYQYGMQIVDYTNSSNPLQITRIEGENNITDIRVKDSILYAATELKLKLIDISDPSDPDTINTVDYPAYKFWLRNNELFASTINGFRIYDINSAESPVMVLNYTDPSILSLSNYYVDDTLVYLTSYGSGMDVIDIANYGSPMKIGSINHAISPKDIFKIGNTVYLTDNNNKIRTVDVSDPEHPVETDSMSFAFQIRGFAQKDSLLFFAGNWHLYALNVSQPELLTLTDTIAINWNSYYDLKVFGNYLYLAGNFNDIPYIDISDLAAPVAKSVKVNDQSACVFINDQYIFAGHFNSGISIIDKSLLFGTDTTGGGNGGDGGNGGGTTDIVAQKSIASAYNLSPNPCKDFIEIRSNDAGQPGGAFRITFYDIQGRICKSIDLSDSRSNHVSLGDLSSGVYIYRITGRSQVITGKIIKEE